MEAPDVAILARDYAVMVRIQGPDPKGLKMRRQPFHLHRDGTTTLSASGLLLPESLSGLLPLLEKLRPQENIERQQRSAIVVTTASILDPFLSSGRSESEHYAPIATQFSRPQLIPETRIDILADQEEKETTVSESSTSHNGWREAKLLALVEVPSASSVLKSMLHNNASVANGSWGIGWSLAPPHNKNYSGGDALGSEVPILPVKDISKVRIAFLEVTRVDIKVIRNINTSVPRIGDFVLVMGSPFGILSQSHFFNSICSGTVANCLPAGASHGIVLMADIRCLPGMDGAPVFNKHGDLVGLLLNPLKQKGSSIEIQLVITWDSIASSLLLNEVQTTDYKHTRPTSLSLSKYCTEDRPPENLPHQTDGLRFPAEMALSSVVLITVGNGAWASGVILSSCGLVLTNAHLLEPWRFGRTSLLGMLNGRDKMEDESEVHASNNLNYSNYQMLRIRLNHKPWVWSDAKVVYISKGPIDIAVLQLESVNHQLCPISVNYDIPAPGSQVHVIGHGPFGPWSDIYPYVSSGAIAKVIKCPCSISFIQSSSLSKEVGTLPVMLETTAAVYPGMSGGAVVNSDGRMIALVTSNAKHGGGKIIPEMNFSIPCAVLEPVFLFAVTRDLSMLRIYDNSDPVISSVWALRPLSSLGPKTLPEINNKDRKGSRFEEFLAKTKDRSTPFTDRGLNMKSKLRSSNPFKSKL